MDFLAYHKSGKKSIVKNKNISFNTDFGMVDRKILLAAKNGDVVKTSTNEELTLIEPSYIDKYLGMKKGAACIKLKDCGAILAGTMVGKDSVCFDCGAGMGGLTCFLARYVKKVYSMDNRKDHLKTVRENVENLGLTNVDLIEGDIYEGIPKKNLDLITLDVISPEKVVIEAKKSLRYGGFVVAYCPQATQMLAFANECIDKGLDIVTAKEINSRAWKLSGKIARPEHVGLMHTGFLIFARKI